MRVGHKTIIALLALLLLMLPACSKGKQGGPRSVPVLAGTAEVRDVPVQIKAIGTVEAYISVVVKSQVSGEIADVFFREGQDVRKGSKLFRIDPRPFAAALRQAEATLARDQAQAKNAELDAQRYASLVERGFVSNQEYDRVRTSYEALAATVKADEAAVENARLQLGYTSIVSPINGRTGSIQVKKGNVVKANDVTLVTINQIMPIYVAFAVPEQELAAVKKYHAAGGLKVEASDPQGGMKSVVGTLSFIDNTVNTSTGTIMLKATFPNRDHVLWPGQFVDIVLTLTTERDRVTVPASAIQTGQQGPYVFVVKEDGTAEMKTVTTGRDVDGWTVIEQGVQSGERVVTDGQLRLTPGAKVEIKSLDEKKPESVKGET